MEKQARISFLKSIYNENYKDKYYIKKTESCNKVISIGKTFIETKLLMEHYQLMNIQIELINAKIF